MFSLIKLNWDDAEGEFDKLLSTINKQNAFRFDTDFILKTALVLINKRAKFAIEKFKGERGEQNLKAIQHNWEKVVDSFGWLSDFLQYAGITSDETLPSYNALVPIIYYAYRNDNKVAPQLVKNNIQTWLYGALLNGNFSGQSDGIIDTCTDVIRDHSTADHFPFQELETTLRRKYGRIVGVNPSIIDSNANLILNLIYLYNKQVTNFQPILAGNAPEIDHIFPKSKMLKTYKKPSAVVNNIGNYMLLEKTLNINKTNKLPKDYFEEAVKQQPEFYERHRIPSDPTLHQPTHFEEFVEARRELLLDTIKRVLVYRDEDGTPIRVENGDENSDRESDVDDDEEVGSGAALKAARKEFYGQIRDKEGEHNIWYPVNLQPVREAGMDFYFFVYPKRWGVKFYMQNEDKSKNKEVFDHLYAEKESIEREFGSELGWQRLDNKRTSRIEYMVEGVGLDSEKSTWPSMQGAMIDKLNDLIAAIYPRIHAFVYPVLGLFLEQLKARAVEDKDVSREDYKYLKEKGLTFDAEVTDQTATAIMWIETRDKSRNKAIFDRLYAKKEMIEQAFGDELQWLRIDDFRPSQVVFDMPAEGVLQDKQQWPLWEDKIIQAQDRLLKAIKPHFTLN